ncbi:MAG: glycosyltransferase family 2 protein, partial [Pyrinomonadaceae bacterium]|nr:glycosyltransferase family 2 protein [Pyrinomonadaceae bacterium]
MPTTSIALCTYNGAKFLDEQLESIARQTRLPDELVICDDCSTDETAQIVKRFAETGVFPVRFCVNEKNLGSTKNFEKAIELCAGEIIFLCDQDDFWEPTKIEKIVAEFEQDGQIGLVFSDAEIVDENLRKLNIKLSDLTFTPEIRRTIETKSFLQILLLRNYITGATLAFKSEFRREFLPLPIDSPEMIHDAWIVF